MTRASRIWLLAAVLFVLVNLVGAGFALAGWELRHAGLHAALVFPGLYLVWRLAPRRVAHA